jgi:hypothetical protein
VPGLCSGGAVVNTRGASAEENFREFGRGRPFLKDERHPRIVRKRMGVVCCFRKRGVTSTCKEFVTQKDISAVQWNPPISLLVRAFQGYSTNRLPINSLPPYLPSSL